jgi:hypothetical protein
MAHASIERHDDTALPMLGAAFSNLVSITPIPPHALDFHSSDLRPQRPPSDAIFRIIERMRDRAGSPRGPGTSAGPFAVAWIDGHFEVRGDRFSKESDADSSRDDPTSDGPNRDRGSLTSPACERGLKFGFTGRILVTRTRALGFEGVGTTRSQTKAECSLASTTAREPCEARALSRAESGRPV